MKIRMTLTMVALLSCVACGPAPSTTTTSPTPSNVMSSSASNENVEQAIKQLIIQRDHSIQIGDTAAIERLYTNDYVSTSATGLVRTKAEVLDDLKSGALKVTSLSSDDVKVRVHGDSAIVTGTSTISGTDKGREMKGASRFTQVWVKRDGRWQLAAFHLSPTGS